MPWLRSVSPKGLLTAALTLLFMASLLYGLANSLRAWADPEDSGGKGLRPFSRSEGDAAPQATDGSFQAPERVTPQGMVIYYKRIAGAAFRPIGPVDYSGDSLTGCIWTSGIATDFFVADLQLPQGAQVDFVRVDYYDSDAAVDSVGGIFAYDGAGGYVTVPNPLVSSSGSSGYGSSQSPQLNYAVDNYGNSLIVGWTPNKVGFSMQLCGMRIRYLVNTSQVFVPLAMKGFGG